MRVFFTLSAAPPPVGSSGGDPPSPGSVTISLRVEPRSKSKSVDSVDLLLPEGVPLGPGATSLTVRLATALLPKMKKEDRSQRGATSLLLFSDAAPVAVGVKVAYVVAGGAPVSGDAVLLIRPAALLLPTVIDAPGYTALMTSSIGASFETATGVLPLPEGAPMEAAFGVVAGVLRSFALARSPALLILYGRTLGGAHVTAQLKGSEDGRSLSGTVKSGVVGGHAGMLLGDIAATLEAEAAAAAGSKEADA